ncbi:MAG: phage protein GemA/Gp16 family protein [Desulfovibrionaceae bacterium]
MATRSVSATRKALLGKVHIGRKQLGLDGGAWRGLLAELFGVASSADLTDAELIRLVDHLAGLGAVFESKGHPRKKPGYQARAAGRRSDFYEIPDGPSAPMQRKVAALWRSLGYDMTSLDTRVRREFGVDALRWLTDRKDLRRLIVDLERRCACAPAQA